MSEDWLKLVKEKLESCETPVPEGVWENVETSLFPAKTRKVRIMPWVWSLAAAAAVALGVFLGIRLTNGTGGQVDSEENSILAEDLTSPDTTISSSADNGGGQVSSSSEPIHIVPAPSGSALAVVTPGSVDADDLYIPQGEKEISDIQELPETNAVQGDDGKEIITKPVEEIVKEVVEDVKETGIVESVDEKDKGEEGFQTTHDGEDWSDYLSATDDKPGRGAAKPSAGLSMSRSASGSQNINTLDTRAFFYGVSSTAESGFRNDASIYTRTVSTPVTQNAEHKRPVRFALSLDFPVSDVLAIESGITYSILQSVFTTSSGGRISEETQTLGYLGIPLNLKLNLLNKDLFTLYTSGGGMVEKCVSGVSKTAVTVDGTGTGNVTKRSFSVKPLIWSLNASAGAQLNLPGSIGIYAEPGVSYHFADNTKVGSIYTEHPFDFVMTFGARLSFR